MNARRTAHNRFSKSLFEFYGKHIKCEHVLYTFNKTIFTHSLRVCTIFVMASTRFTMLFFHFICVVFVNILKGCTLKFEIVGSPTTTCGNRKARERFLVSLEQMEVEEVSIWLLSLET